MKPPERLKYASSDNNINTTKSGPRLRHQELQTFLFLIPFRMTCPSILEQTFYTLPAEIHSMKESSAWFLHFQWIFQQRRSQKRVRSERNMETARQRTIQVGGSTAG